MGLGSNNHESSTRLTVGISKDDKGREHAVIGMRCDESTPGAKMVYKKANEPALDKNGNPVYRLEYDYVEGLILGLAKEETDFGKFLSITIRDGANTYRLRLERGSRYWTDFLMRLDNVRLTAPVRLSPYSIKEEGKKSANQGIAMRQDGDKVERVWNQANGYEGGPPQAEFDEDEQEWKFGKRNNWLEKNVLDKAIEFLASVTAPTPTAAVASQQEQDEGDLPF